MFTLAVCDDDPRQREALLAMVADLPAASGCTLLDFESIDDLMAHQTRRGPVDICLMDIRLGEGSGRFSDGIQAVASLFPEGCGTQIIYVTGYAEYATPVYETTHAYFLLKPVSPDALNAALGKALSNLAAESRAFLPVSAGGAVMRLPVSKIVYLESNRRKVSVHMVDRTVETYAKLSDFEDLLPDNFVRSHVSFLVNMNFIDRMDARSVVLHTGEQLPVSRQRATQAREAFHRHLRGSL